MRLGVAWLRGSNAQYRAFQPMRAMLRRGHDVIWPESEDGFLDLRRVAGCDLVHVYRRADHASIAMIKELQRAGIAVTFDNDDDFTAITPEDPEYGELGGEAGRRVFAHMVSTARLGQTFTTTTEPLAAQYRAAGVDRVEVIGNYLVPDAVRPRLSHDGVVIGWIAGTNHYADVARLPIAGALEVVLERHPEARVECIGVDLGLGERYRHDQIVAFEDLPRRSGAFDIGIAPLADIPFNRARSDIKVKEYAASGVPWLASPVGPYLGLGEEQGGRLVDDDGWVEALDRLVSHREDRERLGRNGLDWARTQTVEAVADRWEAVFADAIERAPAARAPSVGFDLKPGVSIRVRAPVR